jgi:hypothetical protein
LAFTSFGAAAFDVAGFTAEALDFTVSEADALEDEAFAAGVLRVDVFAVFGKTDFDEADLDNTDVARDHSFHCIACADSQRTLMLGMWC